MFKWIRQLFCRHLYSYKRDEVWFVNKKYEVINILQCKCGKELYSWSNYGQR